MIKRILLSAFSLAVAACSKNELHSPSEDRYLFATIENTTDTKTMMDSNHILWSEDDCIIAFNKSTSGLKYQITPSSVGKTSAQFEKVTNHDEESGTELAHNVAYYPYADTISCTQSGNDYLLKVVLPAEQTYCPDTFGNGSFPMVAVSKDSNLSFKSIGGVLKLQVMGTQTISSIEVKGNNFEILSGSATVTAYTDGTAPSIDITYPHYNTATLNCGDGIKLSKEEVTNFYITLPPVVFTKGFTATFTFVNKTNSKKSIKTTKSNAVLRSGVLVMPLITLSGSLPDNEEIIIPTESISLDSSLVELNKGEKIQLKATVEPSDATSEIIWTSDAPSVATVDKSGIVTAISDGVANIYAVSGGISARCHILTEAPHDNTGHYIDEYGIDHGTGIKIGETTWAPVNCGYHATDFRYGKLYQWGRRYGQGYSGELLDGREKLSYGKFTLLGEYSDATSPTILPDPVDDLLDGESKSNENLFYCSYVSRLGNWLTFPNDTLWNSGTESSPEKTGYDPCPYGWRVPTAAEFKELSSNYSELTYEDDNILGRWFSGPEPYESQTTKVFLPLTGMRYETYEFYKKGTICRHRGAIGTYWTSSLSAYAKDAAIIFAARGLVSTNNDVLLSTSNRAYGYPVRCVLID